MIALAALMLVVSGTLAAVLISSNNGNSGAEPRNVVLATSTALPEATETPAATSIPVIEVPEAMQLRFAALPEKLRNETLSAYQSGTLDEALLQQVIEDYENRNASVRVGSVLDTEDGSLFMEVFTTGEQLEVALDANTSLRRGESDIEPVDLQVNELVMVVFGAGGSTALSVEAFGVEAP